MRELTVPARREIADAVTDDQPDRRGDRATPREAGDGVAFRRRTDAGWEPVTWTQFLDEVRALAKGLIAKGVSCG